jgi:hypothetical protein
MMLNLHIETVGHEIRELGEYPTAETAAAKIQEMTTLFHETDLQVGDGLRWENWNDVPEEIRQRCCFESDLPVLTDPETSMVFWYSDDTNAFEPPESF